MKQPIKCDPDILKLLKRVDNQYIDYLVDVITDNGNGRIALSSSIKDLLLAEKAEQDYTHSRWLLIGCIFSSIRRASLLSGTL